jgi:acyl-CoA dehydrogenase
MDDANSEMAAFAAHWARGQEALTRAETVPAALWRAFGASGLFRLGLPEAVGGRGGGYAEIAAAAETLAHIGGLPGLSLSWTLQCQAARFLILGFGNAEQQRRILPAAARGALALAVAISEPGAGAHPKRLAATARADGDEIVLDGQKHWITNGPLADLFVVLAVSGEAHGRKRFSAYLVPRQTPGLTLAPMPALDFLRPSPHAQLTLTGCRVPASARLGPEGTAFDAIARPLRDVEDALVTATLCGAMAWQLGRLAHRGSDAAGLGALAERLAALRAVAAAAVAALDAAPLQQPPESRLAGGFNLLARDFQAEAIALMQAASAGDPALERVTRDVAKTLDIAREARAVRRLRLGQALAAQPSEAE